MPRPGLSREAETAIAAHVEDQGFECVEIRLALEGGRRILRIVLDAPDGVPLDACARVSRSLGALLDDLDDLPSGYVLEVSSPGINRPLTKPEHFQRFLGERAKLRLREPVDGGMSVTGVLTDLRDGVLVIETPAGTRSIALDNVARARLHRDLDRLLKTPREDARPTGRRTRKQGDG